MNSDVTYSVKDLLDKLDTKLDAVISKSVSKEELACHTKDEMDKYDTIIERLQDLRAVAKLITPRWVIFGALGSMSAIAGAWGVWMMGQTSNNEARITDIDKQLVQVITLLESQFRKAENNNVWR